MKRSSLHPRFSLKLVQLLVVAALMLVAAGAQAQILVSYLNTTTTGSAGATFVDSSITAGNFILPNLGSTSNVGFSSQNSLSNVYLRTDFISASESAAVTTGSNVFMSFTLTPGVNPVTMGQLTFELGLSTVQVPAPVVTASAFLRSSLDNFASTIGTSAGFTSVTAPTNGTWGTSRVTQTFNLGSDFVDLTAPVTFRIYFIDDIQNTNTSLRFRNVQVSSIPEPTTWALLGVGVGVLMLFRRRAA